MLVPMQTLVQISPSFSNSYAYTILKPNKLRSM